MKPLILVLSLLSFWPAHVLAGDTPDTPGNRQAAAERYLAVAPLESMLRDVVEKTSENLPEDQRRGFVDLMGKYLRIGVLERSTVASMVRHFTVRELNALADFYGSPEGKSAMKKFGLYMADVMPVIDQEMKRAFQEYKDTK